MAAKGNIVSSIRLPPKLRLSLKREVLRREENGEPKVSFGDLLSEAWDAYKPPHHGTPTAISELVSNASDAVFHNPQGQIEAIIEAKSFPRDLKLALEERSSKEAKTFEELVTSAIREFIGGTKIPVPVPSSLTGTQTDKRVMISPVPQGEVGARTWEKHRHVHEDLQYILDRGPKGMGEDIQGNIRWFVLAARTLNGEPERSTLPFTESTASDHEDGAREASALEHEHRQGSSHPRAYEKGKRPGKKKAV